jgi:ABC-2 type transport system permease protein
MIMRSPFDGCSAVLYPLFFATVAFFVFRVRRRPRRLLYASLGRAVMGIWSATSTTRGSAMQRERWHGHARAARRVADALRARPAAVTIAMATIGIYSMVATLLWGGSRSAST